MAPRRPDAAMMLRLRALGLLALVLLVGPAHAQVLGRFEGRQATPGSGYYVNARPGEATTRVYVWGTVRAPGVYEVGEGFDLQSVLSLAGLPIDDERNPGDPEVYVSVYRPGSGSEPVYRASLDRFATNPEAHPALREGDVLTVGLEPEARVNVWGAVRAPGLYEVGPGFDAPAVLSLAGGPLLPQLQDKDTREVTVTYARGETQLFEGDLDAFVQSRETLPMPQTGDVIEVEVRLRRGITYRDVLGVVGSIAGVASAIALIVYRLN